MKATDAARWSGCLGALALLWLLASTEAQAQPRRVLVVVDPSSPGVLARLRSELAGMGLEIVVSERPEDLRASASLEALARRSQGAAVLRLRPGRERIEVAIADASGALVQHEQPLQGVQKDDGVVALRMAELLRASLLEVPASPTSSAPSASSIAPAPSASLAPPAASASPPATSPAVPLAFGARVGPSVLYSPGGLGPMLHAKAGLSGELRSRSRVRWVVDALIPLGPSRLETQGGNLSIFTAMASVGGQVRVTGDDGAISGSVGAAIGLLWSSFEADAVAPYQARSERALAAVPQLRGEASRSIGESWRLWGEATAGRSLSPLDVRLPGQASIHWGNVIATGACGLEFAWLSKITTPPLWPRAPGPRSAEPRRARPPRIRPSPASWAAIRG